MSKHYLPANLREQLLAADDQRCAYCRTTEANTGQPMTVDHVIPEAQGGQTTFDNLCFACRRCNEFKGSATAARDPLTDEIVSLFHPRTQAVERSLRLGRLGDACGGFDSRRPCDGRGVEYEQRGHS